MNKEIGSDFWNIEICNDENHYFSDDIEWCISGRDALNYILQKIKQTRNIKTVALPSWCCDTMIKPILHNNLDVSFYSVRYENDKLIKNIDVKADVLINLDYFGYKTNEIICFDGVVVNDITHSVFVDYKKYDYCYGSLRKWSGFKTGGFVYSNNISEKDNNRPVNLEYIELRLNAMREKNNYISGINDDKNYLSLFEVAEKKLDSLYNFSSTEDDIYCAKHFDIEFVKNKRQENAKELLKYIKEFAIFKDVNNDDCPLFVPILVPNGKRNELREYLKTKKIYCPIHWQLTDLHDIKDDEKRLYNDELSIICDQRYNIDDMKFICENIRNFLC